MCVRNAWKTAKQVPDKVIGKNEFSKILFLLYPSSQSNILKKIKGNCIQCVDTIPAKKGQIQNHYMTCIYKIDVFLFCWTLQLF